MEPIAENAFPGHLKLNEVLKCTYNIKALLLKKGVIRLKIEGLDQNPEIFDKTKPWYNDLNE